MPALLITTRQKAGPVAGMLLAVAFAAVMVPIAFGEHLLGLSRDVVPGELAPMTVRLVDGHLEGHQQGVAGRIVVARGSEVTPAQADLVRTLHQRAASSGASVAGLGVAFALIALLLTAYLRASQRGRLLRTQLTVLAAFAGFALLAKLYLVFTPLSSFLLPTGAMALLIGALVDRNAGIGSAVALGLIVSALVPFDAPVAIVLGAQGVAAVLALTRIKQDRSFLLAGIVGGSAAAGAYAATTFLYSRALPLAELADPMRSALLASFVGGVLSGVVAVAIRSALERLVGEIPKARLVELADLENPLLKQIAAQSPGTWQHSLAMANMAEIAANAIGANALLVRCGAYYHDLGKSLQPQYYIENLGAGQASPHDQIPPEVSADAIFSHVTEGVRIARERGIPEPIIDFMYMHHGDGLLEYFWAKCVEQGNPKRLTDKAFRYPGVPPQSRETAILTICDAVEAASRSLRQPDAKAIESLVQRIVYGKLHLGQLDQSGLSVADLRILAKTLVETLKSAHHIRIEYPWQRQEAADRAAADKAAAGPDAVTTNPSSAAAREAAVVTQQRTTGETTRRFATDHVLDSADSPRPFFSEPALTRDLVRPLSAADSGSAITQPIESMPPALAVAPVSRPAPAPAPEPISALTTLRGGGLPAPASLVRPAKAKSPEPPAESPAESPVQEPKKSPPVEEPKRPAPPMEEPPLERPIPIDDPPPARDPVPPIIQAGLLSTARGFAPAPRFSDTAPMVAAAGPEPEPEVPGRQEPTIELLREDIIAAEKAATALQTAVPEPVEDAGLSVGTMILGPPPATRPHHDDQAAEPPPSAPSVTQAVPPGSMTPPRRRRPPPPPGRTE